MPRKSKRVKELEEVTKRTKDFFDYLSTAPPDMLAEALGSTTALDLAREDSGWLRITGTPQGSLETTAETRLNNIILSRAYWHRDPLAKQAVRLWTAYSIGTGFSVQTKKKSNQKKLEEMMTNVHNRRIFSAQGQQRNSYRMLLDGEVFFPIFDTAKGPIVRRIDATEIVKIITHPEDDDVPVYYRREKVGKTGRAVERMYYKDWAVDELELEDVDQIVDPDFPTKGPIEPLEDVVVYHAAFDPLKLRGNPLLEAVVDWAKEFRRFMQARVAITQALARLALKLKVKGGSAAVAGLKNQLETTLDAGNSAEGNPPPAWGSTWLENAGAELTQMGRNTGASGARDDADLFKLQVSAGTSIMLHYFGDPSTGNLATSTSMELPMMKVFQMFQKLWTDTYVDLFKIMMDDNKLVIDLDWPPIIEKDLQMIASVVKILSEVYPEMMEQDEVQLTVFSAFGLNNVSEVIKKAQELKDKKEKEMAANPPPVVVPPGTPPPPETGPRGQQPSPPATKQEVEKLTSAISKLIQELDIDAD